MEKDETIPPKDGFYFKDEEATIKRLEQWKVYMECLKQKEKHENLLEGKSRSNIEES